MPIFKNIIKWFQAKLANTPFSKSDTQRVINNTPPLAKSLENNRQSSKYSPGEVHEGVVSGIKDYGIFVTLPNGEAGLVYQNEIAWSGEQPISYSVGNLVDVKVLSFKPGYGISLSLRQVRVQSSFDKFIAEFPVGSTARGLIKSIAHYGVFVTVAPGISGLIHISKIPDIQHFNYGSIGNAIDVRVIEINPEKTRIGLELI